MRYTGEALTMTDALPFPFEGDLSADSAVQPGGGDPAGARRGAGPVTSAPGMLTGLDPTEHTRIRRLVSKAFSAMTSLRNSLMVSSAVSAAPSQPWPGS